LESIDFQPVELKTTKSLAFQITIYRIVQELLSNAVQHGKATNIVVQCGQIDSDFLIAVKDNGMGFDKTIRKQKTESAFQISEGTTVHIELHDHEEG